MSPPNQSRRLFEEEDCSSNWMSFESRHPSEKLEDQYREMLLLAEKQREIMSRFSSLAKKPSLLHERSRATKLFCIKNRGWLYGFDQP